jgi:hypothetical protein
METKIRKFIRNIPEDNVKDFLIGYNLEFPDDFEWKAKSKNYHNQLFSSIRNHEDDKKQNLFNGIERVHGMSDELGQNALCCVVGNNEIFLDQKSDHARSLWVYSNFSYLKIFLC